MQQGKTGVRKLIPEIIGSLMRLLKMDEWTHKNESAEEGKINNSMKLAAPAEKLSKTGML